MTARSDQSRAMRDSAIYFGAQLSARFLNFGYFLLLTQFLPIDQFGVLNYAISIVVLIDIVMDLGLSRHAMRELSKTPDQTGQFIRQILPYKFAVTMATFAIFSTLIMMSDQPSTYKAINIFVVLGLFFTSPAMLLENVLQAHHKFTLISLAHVALSILQLSVGGLILWFGGSAVAISLTFTATYLLYASILAYGVWSFKPVLPPRADFRALMRSIPSAFPYLISAVVIMFAIRAEFVILGFFGSKEDLAVFGMATKIVEASLLCPMAFTTVMSPRFSAAHVLPRKVLTRIYVSGLEMMTLLATIVCLVSFALVPVAQWLLGTEHFDAIDDVLYITFLGYIPASIFLYNTALLFGAVNQTRPLVILTGLGIAQIAINVMLQSSFGIWGAAMGFVVFMSLGALVTTVAIMVFYLRKGALLNALSAPVVGLLVVAVCLGLLGTGVISLLVTACAFAIAVWLFRHFFPERVTPLDLATDAVSQETV